MKTLILSIFMAFLLVSENAYPDPVSWYSYIPYGRPDYLPGSIFSYMSLGGSPYPAGYFSQAQLFNINSGYSGIARNASYYCGSFAWACSSLGW